MFGTLRRCRNRRPTRCSRSSTPSAMHGDPSTSSAAIRTMCRCRWTTSCGRSSAATAPSSSIPVSTRSTPQSRNRRLLRTAAEGLALIGVDAAAAPTVVITHLHYDHVGGFDQFPNARFHRPGSGDGVRHRPAHDRQRVQPRVHGAPCRRHGDGGARQARASSTTATPSSRPVFRCTTSAATPTVCRRCG